MSKGRKCGTSKFHMETRIEEAYSDFMSTPRVMSVFPAGLGLYGLRAEHQGV